MAENQPTAQIVLSDEFRCTRNGSGHWRCAFPRIPGHRYCEKHRLQDQSKTKKKKKKMEDGDGDLRVPDEREEEEEEDETEVLELGQVWAFSADSDSPFPRCYARIDGIFRSLVSASALALHPVSDEEVFLSHQGHNLPCGIYRVSESSFIKEISEFTHRVKVDIDDIGMCKIFPNTGEIWAVYAKPDEYKLVEVVSELSEEKGAVDVLRLIEVEGGRNGVCCYRREEYEGFYLVRGVERGSTSVFSHRVAAARVVEEGGEVL